jgi:hypothetical protein
MDNDFPTVLGGNGFLNSYYREKFGGGEQYAQSGTNIPTFSVSKDFEGGESTDIPPYYMEEVSSTPIWGGSAQQEVPRDVIEKLQQPVKTPGKEFFDKFREQWGLPPHGLEQAAAPSFDVNKPYIPGQQDYTGIPNATPEMLRRLQQRKTRNPGGQEDLPGFLKPI